VTLAIARSQHDLTKLVGGEPGEHLPPVPSLVDAGWQPSGASLSERSLAGGDGLAAPGAHLGRLGGIGSEAVVAAHAARVGHDLPAVDTNERQADLPGGGALVGERRSFGTT
jgi:hypothetical protein